MRYLVSVLIFLFIIVIIGCGSNHEIVSSGDPFEGVWLDEYAITYVQLAIHPMREDTLVRKNLVSEVTLGGNEFRVDIFDTTHNLERSSQGRYRIMADTVFFDIMNDSLVLSTRSLLFQFMTEDSLSSGY